MEVPLEQGTKHSQGIGCGVLEEKQPEMREYLMKNENEVNVYLPPPPCNTMNSATHCP